MNYRIDTLYREKLSEYEKSTSRCECILPKDCTEYSVRFENKTFTVKYKSLSGNGTAVYKKGDLLCYEVRRHGLILIFKNKKFVFIPVTNDEDQNDFLMGFCRVLNGTYRLSRERVGERLAIPDGEGSTMLVGIDPFHNPFALIGVALLAAFLGFVFFIGGDDYDGVTREDCTVIKGVLAEYESSFDGDDHKIRFEDDSIYWLERCTVSAKVEDGLKSLSEGDSVLLLWHAETESVMGIENEGREILTFDWAYRQLYRDARAFYWMGIGVWCLGGLLLCYGIYNIKKEREEK